MLNFHVTQDSGCFYGFAWLFIATYGPMVVLKAQNLQAPALTSAVEMMTGNVVMIHETRELNTESVLYLPFSVKTAMWDELLRRCYEIEWDHGSCRHVTCFQRDVLEQLSTEIAYIFVSSITYEPGVQQVFPCIWIICRVVLLSITNRLGGLKLVNKWVSFTFENLWLTGIALVRVLLQRAQVKSTVTCLHLWKTS